MQQPSTNGGRPRRVTAYQRWKESEGIPEHRGSYVQDLHAAEVADWPRFGQRGAFVSLSDQQRADCYLLEVAPGGETTVQHHLFEASLYVLHGRGATSFWQTPGGGKQTVEWERGSVFSPPLNCYYQHFNLDGQKPARLFTATTASLQINIARDVDFVFNCDYIFKDRYNAEDDYFTNPGKKIATRRWQTNFIPDTRGFKLEEWKERGAGGSNMFFVMSGNAMSAHMSEFPPGTYKKAHKHGPGAEIIILGGVGYSLLWYRGQPKQQVQWKEGSIFSPRDGEYHQHFNSGPEPARYLAYTFGALVVSNTEGRNGADVSEKEGGWQIEYEDEDADVIDLFERECSSHGAKVTMGHPLRAGVR